MTDEGKLYAVKNDEGEWMSLDGTKMGIWYSNNPTLFKDKSYAEAQSMGRRAHVVELVEAPAKVVVSEEEAEMLERAKASGYPVSAISGWCYEGEEDLTDVEDRLMRAYVNGYTVAKEKRYQLKVPYADGWIFQKYSPESKLKHHNRSGTFPVRDTGLSGCQLELTWFTAAELQQYGLQGCERVGVTDDDD